MSETPTLERQETVESPAEQLRAGVPASSLRLIGADLAGADLTGLDLAGVNLSEADLSNARLTRANLRGATLFSANLCGAELLGAELAGADFTDSKADGAGFGSSDLRGAVLFNARCRNATFTQADLTDADIRAADLSGSRLRECMLDGADLSSAKLDDADLERASTSKALFVDTSMRAARLRRISGYDDANWVGADILNVDFTNAYMARRVILDQNFLHEFRNQSAVSEALYKVWWATSDCGRSFVRWGLWTVFIALVFAGAYEAVEVDYGSHPTFLSSIYYSVVTLTTLGYGDVLPASPAAQMVAMTEVILGYVMLGGLLSIFSNKMARRAE